jgi:succinate dehydrogenase / fumarate reductase iron-sulfur subunit
MPEARTVHLKVKRQDGPQQKSYWHEFRLPWRPHMNVISALMEIQRNPVTTTGQKVTPVVWECVCLEEVCGSCTMLVGGRVRQSCSAMIDRIAPDGETIVLEPMTKFPIVRDLVVDRSRMFEDLKRVKAWIHLDGTHEIGPGPRQSQDDQETAYPLSRCMTCGCCLEACPQISSATSSGGDFVGPAAISLVRLYNLHPSGRMHAAERLDAVMGEGGIEGCGKAQNCVEVCPKEIPLVDSIAAVGRSATKRMLVGWLLE